MAAADEQLASAAARHEAALALRNQLLELHETTITAAVSRGEPHCPELQQLIAAEIALRSATHHLRTLLLGG